MSRLGRTLFLIFAATAVALVIGTAACTRRGGNGMPPVPTPTPVTTYYVDPLKGKDTNNGTTPTTPFKTIARALKAVKASTTTGLTIALNPGNYSVNSGETFPIVIPTGVSLTGSSYARAVSKSAFINGWGEDTTLEKAEGKPDSHTLSATIVVPTGVSLTLDKVYVGTVGTPSGTFGSVDVMGSMSASSDTFAQGKAFAANGGIVVPGGTLTCIACVVLGRDFAIKAFSLSASSSSGSGSGSGPSITLQGPGHSVIGGGDGIRTDGTATVTASAQVFQSRNDAYIDSLAAPTSGPSESSPSPSPTSSAYYGGGSVDFGYGAQSSTGGNTFVSGSATEINVTLAGEQVVARNNTWNVIPRGPQKTNDSGQYPRTETFRSGTDGRNIKIAGNATNSTVIVGPAKGPTPTPSPTTSPYSSASPSPTASPT